MLRYLYLLILVLPVIELAVLIWIGVETVWWVPVALVVMTGIVGTMLARRQGWRVGTQIQSDLRSGRVPTGALLDGFLIFVAAMLLVTPGVITDVLGVMLLLPPVRAGVKRALFSHVRRQVQVKSAKFNSAAGAQGAEGRSDSAGRDMVIDAKVISMRVEDAT